VQIIPNGVDMEMFVPMDAEACRQKLGWKEGGKHILFPADPDRMEKDFPLAQETVKQSGQDITIHVFRQVEHKDTVLHYNAADAVLLTSKWEGSPNAIKEAMACCRPIVSTNVGDVKERLSGVEGCYVAETRDPNELSGFLRNALEWKGRTNGRDKIIADQLESKQIADKIITIYKNTK
jgi:glycosyltransferase involved in cell wall biosynthesis